MRFEEYVYDGKLSLPSGTIPTNIDELLDFLQRNSNVRDLTVHKSQEVKDLAEKLKPETLSGLKKLSFEGYSLTIGQNPIGAPTMTGLAKSLVKIACLSERLIVNLDLQGKKITPPAIRALANVQDLGKIKGLNLSNTKINIEGIRALAGSRHILGLKHLDLGSNTVGDEIVKLLAESQHMSQLEHLNLRGCGIVNAEALAQSSYMANLKHLDLSDNKLSLSSIEELAKSPHMSKLEHLNLHNCEIVNAGALSRMANLKYLDLSGNDKLGISTIGTLLERKFDYLSIRWLVESGHTTKFNDISDVYPKYKKFCELIIAARSAWYNEGRMLDQHIMKKKVFDLAAQDPEGDTIIYIVQRPGKYSFLINSRLDGISLSNFYNNNRIMKEFLFSRGMIPEPEQKGDARLQEMARSSQSVHFKEPIDKVKLFTRELVKRIRVNNDRIEQAVDSYLSDLRELSDLYQSHGTRVRLFPLTEKEIKDIKDLPESGLQESRNKEAFIKFIFDKAKKALDTVYLKKSGGQYEATHAEVYDDESKAKITIPKSIGYIKLLIDTYDPLPKARKDLLVDLAAENRKLIGQKLPEIKSKLGNNDISLEQITDRSRFHELLQDIDGDKVDSLFKQISDLNIKEIWREQAEIALLKKIFEASLVGGPGTVSCSQGAWVRIIESLDQINPEFTELYDQHSKSVWEEVQKSGIDDAKGKKIAESVVEKLIEWVRGQRGQIGQPELREALEGLSRYMIDVKHPEQITLGEQRILSRINQEWVRIRLGGTIPIILRPDVAIPIPKNSDYQMIIGGFSNNKKIDTFVQLDRLEETSKKIKNLEQGKIAQNREALKTEIEERIEGFTDNGIDVNTQSSEGGEALLHLAVRIDDKTLCCDLLSKGAIFNLQSKEGFAPKDLSKSEEVLKLLTSVERAFLAINPSDFGRFRSAIQNSGSPETIALVRDKSGCTLLSLLVSNKPSSTRDQANRLEIVNLLIEKGADINFKDAQGNSLLYTAVSNTDKEIVNALLRKGAVIDDATKLLVEEMKALPNPNEDIKAIVEKLELLERAFHFVSMGDFDSVDNLLKESSEDYIRTLVKVRNSSGNTLLYEAVAKEQANQENQVKIIDLLIKNGAADGLQDPNGKSTLYVAIKNKGEKIIDFLLKKGAVVDGVTIEFAKQNSNEAIVKKLEKHVLGEFAQCSSGSSRVKREVSDCISWEDIDEFNEAEEQDRRNPEKIEINSEKFLDYLKEVQGGKRSALIELVNKVGEEQVAGKFQDVVNKLTSNQKVMSHLNKVGRVSGALMHGMMYKSLFGALSRGDLKGVATSSGFIILSHVSGKISEAAYSKGVALMIDGKVLLGRLSKIGGSVPGRIFVPFMVYSAVEDGIACRKGNSDSCVSLGGDVAFLATDAIGIGVEVAEAFGLIEGVSSVTGPIGAAVGVVIFIGTDIYFAVKRVNQEDKVIHLTGWERFTEGGRAFIGMNPDSKIQELMEEKEANNQLVQHGLEFLKNNTDIQASVFPTGKFVVDSCITVQQGKQFICGGGGPGACQEVPSYTQKCTTKLQIDLDSTVNLFTKRTDIKWSRASPDGREDGGSFVCYPKGYYWSIPAHGAYLCENAIGVGSLTNGTGPIFVNLGEGTDDFIGSPNNPHIIIVEKGNKTFDGGRKNDLFMLSGSDISGRLDGRGGTDTLDLGNFALRKKVEVNLDNHYIKHQDIPDNVLRVEGFENVLGRKEEAEKTYATCETKYIDSRGGKSDKESDLVVMDKKKHCSYKTQTAVRPFTYVKNYADNGTFGYIVNPGQGQANINLFGAAQHNFVFNYSLSEIESINKTQNRVTFSLGDLGAESRFNITILETKGGQNVSYYFSDNSKIVFEGRNIFALQNTNRSISELIDNYLPIVNRLGIYFSAQSGSESIVMAHKNNDVIESNPNGVTYLIGGDGKNVYVINPGSKLPLSRSKLPLPKVVIYYFDRENTGTATIDFRSVFREVYDKLCKHIEPKVMQGNVDLVLQLQCLDHGRDGGENYYISTVELKGGVSWYNRVHVMVENVPVKIEQLPSRRNHSEWTFTPSPLHFGKEYNIIYISTHDVLRNQKINTHRKVGEYKLLKDKDNLIITCEDKYSVIIENFFKNPVMQTLKVDFTDRRINLAEIDRSNITELNNMKDEYKKLIDKILNEHKESQNTITSNSTAPHRRERRDIIRVPRGFDIFSVALFRVFGIHREILLVPKKNDIMEVSLEEEMLPEELQQPSVSNNIPQSIEDRPLSKPIYGEKFLGEVQASAEEYEEYSDVFEEGSLASTTKLPLEIELQKKSNDKGSVYKENIPSSARKPESLINIAVRTFANAVKSATLGAAQLIPSLFKLALPFGHSQKEDFQSSDEKRNPSSEFRGQFSVEVCAQNNITALNVLLQNFLDRRYPLPQTHETTSEEAQAYAINITAEFEQILKCTAIRCGISVQNLDFNNWEIQSTIRIQALNNEKEEIFKTLCSVAEKACPNLTQRETFLTEIKNQLVRNLAPMSIADDKSWLEYTDIINLVKTKYGYNSENSGFLCNSKKVQQLFSVIGAGAQLTNTLKEFKTIGRKGEAERLTLIINTGDNHWVTLVVSHKTRECYYADSLCKNIPEDIRQSLSASGIKNVKNVSTLQQRDTYNCGIFALENTQSINLAIDHTRNPEKIKSAILQSTCSLEEIGKIRSGRNSTNHAATNFYGAKDLPPNDTCANTPGSFLSGIKMTDYSNNLARR